MPPYMICHNKALRQMARKRPRTADELESIPGIGGRFVEQYATHFLAAIGKFDSGPETEAVKEDDIHASAYQERLRKIRFKHPRAYEPWSDDEDDRLRQMVEDGQSIREMARFLERRDSAIRRRIKKLG